jgi:hypothetical protein
MGLGTEELTVSSSYTISECATCHMTVTFAGSGNFSRKPRQKLSGIANSQSHFTAFVKCKAAV